MNTSSRLLANIIAAANGQFFTVTFVKKNGDTRTMNCRSGVVKHTKGGVSTLDSDKYFTVYDVQQRGYRAINKDTIIGVRVGGVEAVAA